MAISFAGEPLMLVTPQLQEFLDRFFPLEDLQLFGGESVAVRSNRSQARNQFSDAVNLGLPNYPPPPPLRINSLYWPTGASRWSRFLGICDKATKDKIVTATYGGVTPTSGASNTAKNLILADERPQPDGVGLSTLMYLLPPRPITCVGGDAPTLWLLPLVDERYYWQFRHTDDLAVTTSTTWANLFSTLATRLGVQISADTVSANYFKPDPTECSRRYANAAVLLDIAAHSVGQRIVRYVAGTIKSQNWANGKTQLTSNIQGANYKPWTQIAGDDFSTEGKPAVYPASVVVAFTKTKETFAVNSSYVETKAATLYVNNGSTTGAVKVIRTTSAANYNNAGTLQNGTDTGNLAGQIASDYYASLEKRFDYSFNSLKKWDSTPFDDAVEWHFGELREVGGESGYQYLAGTRIQSSPHNFGVEEMCQQSGTVRNDTYLIGILDADLDYDSSASVSFYNGSGNSESDTGDNVTAYDWLLKGGDSLTSGSKVYLSRINEIWYVTEVACPE